MTELGIVDLREINKIIYEQYGYDFSNFAITSYKQRLEYIIMHNNLSGKDELIRKISGHPGFFDIFLHEISVPSSEMFRDPSLWRWLREEVFATLSETNLMNFKIWFPYCVSGGELYSMAILLKEMDLLNKVKIIASYMSERSLELIRSGDYDLKKTEISAENYRRFHGSRIFKDYYNIDRYYALRDTSLINNVEFIKQNINFDNAPYNVRLILFRNTAIYFNPNMQETVLSKLHNSLSVTGYLIVGSNERLRGANTGEFEFVNEAESVYKKKI